MTWHGTPFDLSDLHLLMRIAQLGGLNAAARSFGITPAGASRRLLELQTRIGLQLFERNQSRLRLTAAGAAFLPYAARILSAADEAQAALDPGACASGGGLLRLMAPTAFGSQVLTPLLADMLVEQPALRLDLLLTDMPRDLGDSGYDAAVRLMPEAHRPSAARRLGESRRVLCAAPAYLARHGRPESADELAWHDGLMALATDGWTLRLPDGLRRVRPLPRVTSDSAEALREACLAGLGIGLHATWEVSALLRRGDLVALSDQLGTPEPLAIWLLLPGALGATLPRPLEVFLERLARHLDPVPLWDRQADPP